jgi:oligopeptide transport system substrate-binding protein
MPIRPSAPHPSLLRLCLALCAVTAGAEARTLERGNGPEPSTLDAHRCQEIACANVLRDLYEGLVSEDAQGRQIPGLAESWTRSEDGLGWTFLLRANARWSDGTPIDAPQLVASFRRALSPATAAPLGPLLHPILNAEAVQAGRLPPTTLGVSAQDARTLRIELAQPVDLLPRLLLPIAFPVRLDAIEAHGSGHTQPGRLQGNGAYRLLAWRPQAAIELERNPHFHSPVQIERVRFHVTEDAAAELKRFAAGDLHITETVPPARLEHLRERFGEALQVSPYLGVFFLGVNLRRPPLDSADLREALNLAIDRRRLVASVTGMGEAPAYGLVPPGVRDYQPPLPDWAGLEDVPRLERARAAYARAGYGPGKPARLELRFNSSTVHRRVALAVAAMWREQLGVITELRNEEWKVFVANRRQGRVTEVFRGGWIADYDDAVTFLDLFAEGSALNWAGYVDAEFERLRAEAAASIALLPLYFYTSKHLVDPRLQGYEPNPLDRHPSRFLRWRE